MKITDRILSVPAEVATTQNPHYEEYRTGLKRAGIGAVAALGGLVFHVLTGSEVGIDIAASGAAVLYWGGAKMAVELSILDQQAM